MNTFLKHTYIHTYIFIPACMNTYKHTYKHACMHACIHTHIHTHKSSSVSNFEGGGERETKEHGESRVRVCVLQRCHGDRVLLQVMHVGRVWGSVSTRNSRLSPARYRTSAPIGQEPAAVGSVWLLSVLLFGNEFYQRTTAVQQYSSTADTDR